LFLKKLKIKITAKIIFGIAIEKGNENNNNATPISKKYSIFFGFNFLLFFLFL